MPASRSWRRSSSAAIEMRARTLVPIVIATVACHRAPTGEEHAAPASSPSAVAAPTAAPSSAPSADGNLHVFGAVQPGTTSELTFANPRGAARDVAPPRGQVTVTLSAPSGNVTNAESVVRATTSDLTACYVKALASDPAMEGVVHLELHVAETGEVVDVVAKSDDLSTEATECMKKKLLSTRFAPPGVVARLSVSARCSKTPASDR